jgi:hypothetical protein
MAVGNEVDVVLEEMLTRKQQLFKTGSTAQTAKMEIKIPVAPAELTKGDARQKAPEVDQHIHGNGEEKLVSNVELLTTDILSGCGEVTSQISVVLCSLLL